MKGFGLFLASLLCIFKKGLQSNGWSIQVPSDATGEIGKAVVLPCTFTHPHKAYDQTLTTIWRIKEPYSGMVVFKCVTHSSSDLCKTTVSYKNKYKLIGNPRHNNLSIKVDNLTWSDSNRYFCRVEFSGDFHDKYESRTGIKLHLTAAPRIINITIGSNEDHTFKAQCTAEGEPLPSLTWTGPLLSNATSVTSVNHQITKELHYLTHDGKYTCTAVNSHGKAEGAVYFYKFKGASGSWILILMFVALGSKVLVLLMIVGIAVFWSAVSSSSCHRWQNGSREVERLAQGHGANFCTAHGDVTAPSTLSRQPTQDSTYENLDRRNNRDSQRLPTE